MTNIDLNQILGISNILLVYALLLHKLLPPNLELIKLLMCQNLAAPLIIVLLRVLHINQRFLLRNELLKLKLLAALLHEIVGVGFQLIHENETGDVDVGARAVVVCL